MPHTMMHACNPQDLGSGGKKNKHLTPSFSLVHIFPSVWTTWNMDFTQGGREDWHMRLLSELHMCMRWYAYTCTHIYKCTCMYSHQKHTHTYMCAHTQCFKTVTVQNSRWMNKFRDLLYNMVSINNELYTRKLPRQQILKYYHDENWQTGDIKS